MSNGKAYDDNRQLPAGACGQETEVYSRVTGYYRPVNRWNRGKREEFKDRTPYKIPKPKPTIRKIDSGYDPQTGIEFCTYAIND